MKLQDLVHKRCLVASKSNSFNSKSEVEEIKILEVSPSLNWVKIQNDYGKKIWKCASDVVIIEVLSNFDKPSN